MNIKKLLNVGGITSITRYINMLAGNNPFITTTTTDIALTVQASPYVTAYPWSFGFGSKYANPASLPSFYGYGLGWSPSGNDLAFAEYYGVYAYAWSSGFGTKYSSPAAMPGLGATRTTFFNDSGDTVFAISSATPYIYAYPWSSGYGSKYADPSSLPPGSSYSGAFGSNTIFISSTVSPYLTAYPWSAGFGTKYANPSTTPTGGYGIAYNSTAAAIAIGNTSNAPSVYPWSSGFGSKYSDPTGGNAAGWSTANAFNNNGTILTSTYSSPGAIASWPWSAGFGTKYANPSTYTGTASNDLGVSVNKDGKLIGIAGSVTPYAYVYYLNSTSGLTFKYADPITLPAGTVTQLAFR